MRIVKFFVWCIIVGVDLVFECLGVFIYIVIDSFGLGELCVCVDVYFEYVVL